MPLGPLEDGVQPPVRLPNIFEISRSCLLGELVCRVSEDGCDPAILFIKVNEGGSFDAILACPTDGKGRLGFFDLGGLGIAVAGEPQREVIGGVEQPSIAGFGREQDELAERDDAPVVVGGPALDVANLIGETEALPDARLPHRFARSGFALRCSSRGGDAMELFTKLFGSLLVFVYHCFDRIVIHGYLSGSVPARAGGLLLPRRRRRCRW